MDFFYKKNHYELSHMYIEFANMIHTQFSCPVKTLHTDNVLEYKTPLFFLFFSNRAPLFNTPVLIPLNKMGVMSTNIDIFLT